jgi:hypothetical protein
LSVFSKSTIRIKNQASINNIQSKINDQKAKPQASFNQKSSFNQAIKSQYSTIFIPRYSYDELLHARLRKSSHDSSPNQ